MARNAPRNLGWLAAALAVLAVAAVAVWKYTPAPALTPAAPPPPPPLPSPLDAASALADAAAHPERLQRSLLDALRADLVVHRRLVLMTADEAQLSGAAREAALADGQDLYHQRTALVFRVNQALAALAAQPATRRDPIVSAVLDWMERGPELLAYDKLAFRDTLRVLARELATDESPEGQTLRARIARDLADVDRTEAEVEGEYKRGKSANQERVQWNAYVDALRKLYPQTPPPAPMPAPGPEPGLKDDHELSGREFPEKLLVLSFDDGPHPTYTEEIRAILLQHHTPGVFFEVGRNLGSLEADGSPKLGPLSKLTEDLVRAGFVIGNHSYSHAHLNREIGRPLELEISETDTLLKAIPGAHSQLFRFPYGARTAVQLQALEPHHLRSVLWNIDSLDWADPVPSSVADRVLREIEKEKRGIVLFHDIHDRAGKVVPGLITQLSAQGYRFEGLDALGDLKAR